MYFSSIEFTDFPPFAKSSRMEFAPVADKPDDLAEVHLITGENGTGKSRLLCLLAAALGDARALQGRCRKEDVAEFAVRLRQEPEPKDDEPLLEEPAMVLRLGREGLTTKGNRSQVVFRETKSTPAFARAGVSFVEDADFSKAINEQSWTEGRLTFRPGGTYTESLLKKLHKIIVASRLGENDRMMALTHKLETVMSDVLGSKFSFFPRSHPKEVMCVKLGHDQPLSMSQIPDGLRSLIGWLVDAALVMEDEAQSNVEESRRKQANEVITLADDEAVHLENQADYIEQEYLGLGKRHPEAELFKANVRDLQDQAEALRLKAQVHAAELLKDIFPVAVEDLRCIILLDEIETHLHPGWQRQVLPAFQRMFPKAQIFVATHSPFVISSVNYGRVHILRRGEDGVRVETHDAKKGDSYMTAVQEVLGLTGWFDADVEKELGAFELLVDKAYTSNGASEAEMRNSAAHFLEPKNRYSEEVRNMVTNLVAQYDRHRATAGTAKP